MADTSTTSHVFPSANDVRGSLAVGKGKIIYEENLGTKLMGSLLPNNYTVSGGVLPGSSASLTIAVPAVVALLAGRYVSVDAQNVTVGASVTTYLFLKLLTDANGNASSVKYETAVVNTSPPANSTPIGSLISGVGTITSTADLRVLKSTITVLTSGTSWIVPAGITSVFVEVIGASGGGGGGGEGAVSGASAGNAGSVGGAGGTTTFGALTTSGGGAGFAGSGGGTSSVGSNGIAHGVGSGGTINLTGWGQSPGNGGEGGQTAVTAIAGCNGGNGGTGGYSAGPVTVTPGASVTIAIGAAGTSGAGGTGTGGTDGGAGVAGGAGVIVVCY